MKLVPMTIKNMLRYEVYMSIRSFKNAQFSCFLNFRV